MFTSSKFKFSSKNLTTFLFLFSIILLVVLIFFRSFVIDALRFPLSVQSNLTREFEGLFTYKLVLSENIILKKQAGALRQDLVSSRELKLENERLKSLLHFKENSKFNTVAARVIARDPNNWSSGIVLDKGKRQGIGVGDVVISESGLVGKIIEVTANTSKVILIDDPDSAIGAVIQSGREEGLVTGSLYGGLTIRYLDKDSKVSAGDLVLTSGIINNYPQGILIGTVSSIEEESHGLTKFCFLAPAADLKKIAEVLVIIEKK